MSTISIKAASNRRNQEKKNSLLKIEVAFIVVLTSVDMLSSEMMRLSEVYIDPKNSGI